LPFDFMQRAGQRRGRPAGKEFTKTVRRPRLFAHVLRFLGSRFQELPVGFGLAVHPFVRTTTSTRSRRVKTRSPTKAPAAASRNPQAQSDPGAALVLGSGGARAAYEVGVAHFLFQDLARELGRAPDVRILCGSSAGSLNALGLAAFAGEPLSGVSFLAHRWGGLVLDELVKPRPLEVLRVLRSLAGCPSGTPRLDRGGILDPRPFRKRVFDGVPYRAVPEHLRSGRLQGLSFTATEIATGRATLFVHGNRGIGDLHRRRSWHVVDAVLTPEHALASAAIPLLFPPVRISGRDYCDGALRQSVPLSPALHLQAGRMVVVSTQHEPERVAPWIENAREQAVARPLYLLGKALNALTSDRVDDDLERLDQINRLLEAGGRAFGPGFVARLNRAMQDAGGRSVHPIQAVLVRPSQSLGQLAAEHVRGSRFRGRVGGATGALFARLAEGEGEYEADLLSFLLFDGAFAASLMELGRADARDQAEQLRALFANPARTQAELVV
jgi:NTE family protein